jgi:amino acid transporter
VQISLRRILFGTPLRTERIVHERLPIILALPVFASDALSSVSYATEAILIQFKHARLSHDYYPLTLWVSIAIVLLILVVVVSYWQVIYGYPEGGGSYLVARRNLGLLMGLIAASSLLVDYVLTVAVSVAEGVAATFSALKQFIGPSVPLGDYRVATCVVVILLLTLANLRGVRESGMMFAGFSYGFIFVMFTMIATGLYRLWSFGEPMQSVAMPPDPHATEALTPFILLRGFASGCAALTGIEAVANGVQAFREPVARNASITLGILGAILASLFTGISYLAVQFQIGPSEDETVISQIARAAVGTQWPGGLLYYSVQAFTAIILVLAANTAYAAFPRLSSILATDGFMPRQLAALGDRLAFNNGIIVLALLAMLFIVIFGGLTHALLPLYTVGVFIAFTTALAGMVVQNLRQQERHWGSIIICGLGATVTLMVFCLVLQAKFIVPQPFIRTPWFNINEGAWIALLLMVINVGMFHAISAHYRNVDAQLAYIPPEASRPLKHTVIVLVPSRLHRGIVQALTYARSISPDAIAVHIAFDQAGKERLCEQWEKHGCGMDLVILDSPYRSLIGPLMRYLDAAEKIWDDDIITVILPEFVPAKWWHHFLHNASGWLLRLRLHYRRDVVITSVRYYLD